MVDRTFGHEMLGIFRLTLEYFAVALRLAGERSGLHRQLRDESLRAAQSMPRNVAVGDGKRSLDNRSRFLEIARGSEVAK